MAISDFSKEQMVYPSDDYKKDAYINNMEEYRQLYKFSIEDPVKFWHNFSKNFYWQIPPRIDDFLDYNFDLSKGPIFTKWMKGARTNICYNALDRHVINGLGDRIAYYWEGNETHEYRCITYKQLLKQVCKFANFLLSKGIKKGDKVAIYMPVTIDLVVAMLATVRIGAVHTVVFAGFSAVSLSERIMDARCSIFITMDGSFRGKKFIPLKDLADQALEICRKKNHKIKCCIVQRHSNACQGNNNINNNHDNIMTINGIENNNNNNKNNKSNNNNRNNNISSDINNNFSIKWNCDIDIWWETAIENMSDRCDPVWIDAEDDLFILYTSGSTGKPKGVLHTLGGYMVYAATTFKYTFNYTPDDVFFCTADLGWITGHTVNVYGSLANAATIVLFEGTPFYPYPGRLWEIIDKLQVSIFYTAPTAIRSLMKYGDEIVQKYKLDSLKLLGTAGEPINEEAWCWYYRVVGKRRCPIVDTFWQTETAAPILTPLPGCTPTKPGSATLPFFSIVPAIVDMNGKEIEGPGNGILVIKKPWPSIARTVVGNHERYEMTYFHKFKGYFSTGDGCYRDQDGYYWITGRSDDMLNVSGHLLSTAQVESAIVEHKAVAEAAAVSSPHPIKGECIYCFVVLHNDYDLNPELEKDIKERAREKIGALAAPEVIHPISALPKTRSGKIMRRILSKVIRNDTDLGDISTMADESILEELFATRHLYSIVAID